MAAATKKYGCEPQYQRRERPMTFRGVGTGSQSTEWDVIHQISLGNGRFDSYEAPELPDSRTPALLGGKSLKRLGALIDTRNRKLFLCGPGGYEIKLSPGYEAYDPEESEMGHLMLPCSRVTTGRKSPNAEPIVFTVGAQSETASSSTRTGTPRGSASTE